MHKNVEGALDGVMVRGWKGFEVPAGRSPDATNRPRRAILVRDQKEKNRLLEKASVFSRIPKES